MSPFSLKVIALIKSIPAGKVASYGQIAFHAGNHRAARQVSRILHSCSKKYQLPWYRVINSQGKISLSNDGFEHQYQLLKQEGIEFGLSKKIDMGRFAYDFELEN
ncbi:MAG: MGMT family protein [Alcanivoracaceae bacterium]|nr:MGMT family protein [Alcanivoracaceae bacterium]